MITQRLRHVWRRSLRPSWHAVRPLVVVAAGLAVIVLGTIGYSDRHPEFGFWDALYRAFGLFGLAGNEEPPVPWTLQVARLLGPVVFGYAALTALLSLFRQEARLLAIRLLARDHVVVAGLGEQGFRLATALHDDGRRVIVIDRSGDNPRIPGVRERGITVLTGDATDPEMLRRAQTGRAAHLLAVCGDDGTNIDVAAAAETLAAGRRRGVLTAHAHLANAELWTTLSTAAIGSDEPTFRLEFFNVFAHAATVLVARHPPAGDPVLVHGRDGVGEQLVARLAAQGRRVIDDTGTETPATAYVCVDDETAALAAALALRGAAPQAEIVVAVADAGSGVARALHAEGRALGGITAFGVLSSALTADLLHSSMTEVLARAKHDEYVRAEQRRGLTAADNPSLRSWDELPESLKDSNRRFADGIGAKLTATGCVIVPAQPGDPLFAFTGDEVEELAIGEHDRWVADLRRDGWKPTSGPKDAERRLHPLLVAWDELSEDDKDRDRDPVREIPAMLARAGYRIVRT